MQIKKPTIQYFIFIILFFLAFLERTAFDFGPNFEIVTSAIILSAFYLGYKKSFFLTFLILLFSDIVLGNTNIFIFTWTGFLIPAVLSSRLINLIKSKLKILSLLGTGIAVNLFFYLWTNFGVWLLDSWGMYEKSSNGLIKCYINGLPFLKNQIISSVVFIPLLFFAIELGIKFYKKISPEIGRFGLSRT